MDPVGGRPPTWPAAHVLVHQDAPDGEPAAKFEEHRTLFRRIQVMHNINHADGVVGFFRDGAQMESNAIRMRR